MNKLDNALNILLDKIFALLSDKNKKNSNNKKTMLIINGLKNRITLFQK